MMDYPTSHRLHARYAKLRQLRRELKLQLDRFPAAKLAYRHRAVGKIEKRLDALRTAPTAAAE